MYLFSICNKHGNYPSALSADVPCFMSTYTSMCTYICMHVHVYVCYCYDYNVSRQWCCSAYLLKEVTPLLLVYCGHYCMNWLATYATLQ